MGVVFISYGLQIGKAKLLCFLAPIQCQGRHMKCWKRFNDYPHKQRNACKFKSKRSSVGRLGKLKTSETRCQPISQIIHVHHRYLYDNNRNEIDKNRLLTRSEEYVRSNRVSGILRVTKGDTYTEAKQ